MPKHILCADDSLTMQKVVAITFAHTDYQVLSARSADEAMSMARQTRPDLVLADAVMPGKTGYDLCQTLKNDNALRNVPVVILVGNSQAYDETRGKQAGADGHLTKPWDTQVFVEKIGEILGRISSHGVAQAAGAPSRPFAPVPSAPAAPVPPLAPPVPRPTIAGATAPTAARAPAGSPPLGMPPPAVARPSMQASAPARPVPPAPQGLGGPGSLPKPPAGLPRPPLIRGAPLVGGAPRPQPPGGPMAARPMAGGPMAAARPAPGPAPVAPPPPAPPAARANPRSATIMGMPAMQLPAGIGGPQAPAGPPPAGLGGPPPAAPPQQAHAPLAPPAAPTAPGPIAVRPPIGGPPPIVARPVTQPPAPAPSPLPGSDALAKAAQRVAAAGMIATQQAVTAKGGDPRGVEYEAIAKLSREIIERIAWEVVPELAEIILREHVERLKKQ